jgi:uncharacterized alkaline shock family protein YloU
MSDFDNASYSANGGGSDNARAEVRSMPFFPAPPGAPIGPPAGRPAPAMPLGAPTPGPPTPAAPAPAAPASAPPGPAQPGPPGRHSQGDEQPGVSVTKEPKADSHNPGPMLPEPRSAQPPTGPVPVVKGRIKIEDEVVEKIAALAALEVHGVAALGGDVTRATESVRPRVGVGHQRGDQSVQVRVKDTEVSLDVAIVVEYGSVVMEVAKLVKNNVARIVSVMLGMRVTEVNVTVDDVRMPGEVLSEPAEAGPAS